MYIPYIDRYIYIYICTACIGTEPNKMKCSTLDNQESLCGEKKVDNKKSLRCQKILQSFQKVRLNLKRLQNHPLSSMYSLAAVGSAVIHLTSFFKSRLMSRSKRP